MTNKVKGHNSGRVGQSLSISNFEDEDEVHTCMAARISLLCDWGFSLTPVDFKIFIQDHMNKRKVVHSHFKNNVPGDR